MSKTAYHQECEFIKKVIVNAYDKYKKSSDYKPMHKESFDIVTSVDLKIEEYIIKWITKEFPQDRILSEETKSDTLVEGRTWTIDPIDGTYNMANDMPFFGVQCSMFNHGKPVVSAIYLPFANEMYYATENGGAFLNDERIRVKSTTMEMSIVSFGDFPHSRINDAITEQEVMNGISSSIARIRMFGAACFDFAYLASGKIHGTVIFTKNRWDISPGILLCQEAGAIIKGENGDYTSDSRVVIAVANNKLYECIAKHL